MDQTHMGFRWRLARLLIIALLSIAGLAGCQHAASPRPRNASAGEAIANTLNDRYRDIRPKCDNDRPAYFCSGIVIRAVYWGPTWYFWNTRPVEGYDGVSFSYVRRDAGEAQPAFSAGYIFAPADQWRAHEITPPLIMHCSYPFDAFTGPARGRYGCGEHISYGKESGPCADLGITTVQGFAIKYQQSGSSWSYRGFRQCSFGADTWQAFHLSVLARQGGALQDEIDHRYSEQMISRWPDNIPEKLPFEALFYEVGGTYPEHPLADAQAMQHDYLEVTGRLLPIVRIDAQALKRHPKHPEPFSFHPEDQGVRPDVDHTRPAGMIPSQGAPTSQREMLETLMKVHR